MTRILVINPNSSNTMTASMDRSLDILRRHSEAAIDCILLPEGPPGIETEEHITSVALPLLARTQLEKADAFVVACFADPGVRLLRGTLSQPVFGIAESAYFEAIQLGSRFGIVSIASPSIARHARHLRELGLIDRLAADCSIDTGTAGVGDADTVERIKTTGRILRDEHRAEVIILGCAGLGTYRPEIEDALGLAVVDPVQAAAAQALSRLALNYRRPGAPQ